MADQESVAKRLQGVEKEARRSVSDALKEQELLENLLKHLEEGRLANTFKADEMEDVFIKNLHLLTRKAFLYVFNKKSGSYNFDETNDERWQELVNFVESTGSQYVIVDAGVEHELKDLEEAEKAEFRREYATLDSGIDSLIKGCYKLLGLISFFTTGEKETRAWTIKKDSTAPVAGSAIHTDFEEHFIRALVASFEDLVEAGSLSKARETGKLRTEGKEYIVKDGDVIEFLNS